MPSSNNPMADPSQTPILTPDERDVMVHQLAGMREQIEAMMILLLREPPAPAARRPARYLGDDDSQPGG